MKPDLNGQGSTNAGDRRKDPRRRPIASGSRLPARNPGIPAPRPGPCRLYFARVGNSGPVFGVLFSENWKWS